VCVQGEICSGGRICKDRFEVFINDFITGKTEKALFIAKTAKPNVGKALTSRNLMLIGGPTRGPG
jgi:hypothetical protein